MTQLEITTSTELSSRGICSIVPWRTSTLSTSAVEVFAPGEVDHLGGCVEAVDEPSRTDAARREEHVETAAGSKVEHHVAGARFGNGGRVAAPQAGPHRRRGDPGELVVVTGAERRTVGTARRRAAARSSRRLGVASQA
jgi:hypothetical protein